MESAKQIPHMKEGTDETSYAKSSSIQREVLSSTKPIKEEAIREFYCREQPAILCIADLGCSSSEFNTLPVVSDLIETVENARRQIGNRPQDYQVYLNDLPGTDFNAIFRSLATFKEKLKLKLGNDFGHIFLNGVPGSFYSRLFPSNHLHFVHSSYSLHWLSQVPEGIEDNKRNIYIARTSPPSVLKAYYDQFAKDFSTFLRCRAEEVVAGGRMVLTILGSNTNNNDEESSYMWESLATVLNDMVVEGLIEEKQLNSFNIPQYSPTAAEFCDLVEKEGSFTLSQVHVSEVNWKASENNDYVNGVRAVLEPLLTSHFGETIIEELFQRYTKRVQISTAKEVDDNVTVSLTRKGS